jgi:CRISPR/Cas system endoribonuclease Cas6 (RAMP superfamily)
MTIYKMLKEDIKILNRDLKSEDEIIEILKKRLTKKEFKYYMMRLEGISKELMQKELKSDEARFDEIEKTTIKKLNAEKLKYELSTRV